MIPAEGIAAGAGVWARGAAGVVVGLTGAGVKVGLAVLLESSRGFETVDVAIFHLFMKPEIKR
jgi:hypothetical protein